MTIDELPRVVRLDQLTRHTTANFDVLMDGPALEQVNGTHTNGNMNLDEATLAASVLIELANENAGTTLDFVASTDYERSSLSFLILRASIGDLTHDEIADAGLAMEFGGPTTRVSPGNLLVGYKPDIITNLVAKPMNFDSKRISEIQALADATSMPVADGTLGSVHISRLKRYIDQDATGSSPVSDKAIDESARVLKDGGFLIWDVGNISDIDRMRANGFVPVRMQFTLTIADHGNHIYACPTITFSGAFQKPKD